jgi:hypothetical protein
MSTVCKLSPKEIQDRKRAAALAELERNGISIIEFVPREPAAKERQKRKPTSVPANLPEQNGEAPAKPAYGKSARTLRRRRQQERKAQAAKPEFVSRPDAVEMRPEDVRNVSLLTPQDALELLKRIRAIRPDVVEQVASQIDQDWSELLNPEERYTLTAMAVRKYVRQQQWAV